MVDSMDICKILNINIATVMKNPEILNFVFGHLKTKKMCKHAVKKLPFRGGSRINFRVLQNFTKKIEKGDDVICRKIIDSARSKKVQF